MRKRFALVFNQRAGTIRPLMLDRVLTLMRSADVTVEPVTAASADDATQKVRALALQGAVDAVIAAGGDGTVRAVASGVAGTALPVGYVPLGTGNVLKYEIGLKARPETIVQTLLEGDVLDARCGLVNGELFFLMVGAGFDGRIVGGLNQRTKKLIGRAAYTFPTTGTLIRKPDRIAVEIDGAMHEASWVIVTNAAHYGGSFTLTRGTQLGAGQLIAILVTGSSRRALLSAGLALALGRLGDPQRCPSGVLVKPAQLVRLTSSTPVPLEVDGDEGGTTPAEISASGPQVSFIVPQAYLKGLRKRHTNHLASAK